MFPLSETNPRSILRFDSEVDKRLVEVEPPPVLAIVNVFPLVVRETFAPADNETASVKPLRLLTTCPPAILAPTIVPPARLELVPEPAATPLAVDAVAAVTV